MDVPLVAHISKLVQGLGTTPLEAGRGSDEDLADKNQSSHGETDETDLSPTPKNTDSESKSEKPESRVPKKRRPIRNHRVGPVKTKPWNEYNTILYGVLSPEVQKSKKEHAQKSRVDPKLGGVDPFDAFQLPRNSTTDMALHHCRKKLLVFISKKERKKKGEDSCLTSLGTNVFQETRMVTSPRKAWLSINLSDKTLLSVTNYCSGVHYYFIRRTIPPPICLVQKADAIRNINSALRKPGYIPSDLMICAVTVMTILEVAYIPPTRSQSRKKAGKRLTREQKGFSGEPAACIIHRKGLQSMIKARGGIHNLGFGGQIERVVSWADIVVAILLREKPSLKPTILTPSIGEPEANTITNYTCGTLNARLQSLTHSTPLTKRLIYIWLRLRSLSTFLLAHTHDIDDYYFSDKCDSLERQILSLLHSPSKTNPSSSLAFTTAFLNAALIYTTEELRECPKYTNICIALSARIYSGLQMAEFDALAAACPELLLWVLVMGRSGIAPVEEGEASRRWYNLTIADVEARFGIVVPPTLAGWAYFEVAERTLRGGDVGESGDE
ncbi:hypothetical protein LSUB1_G007535 [Lachnellula subtilissima]|uniref:Uncharacterized protein n=1 Tax=Lachnellula subtilissima TaxID=602034 RepID=A0A8H8RC52_9HELO|nr:hypothetical protein LSUB1_G007535 [Lachnellula subtilissima]